MNTENAMITYTQVYQALYRRSPRELRDLGSGWVQVNGGKMTLSELEKLAQQMQVELQAEQTRKRGLVGKLMKFFGGASTTTT